MKLFWAVFIATFFVIVLLFPFINNIFISTALIFVLFIIFSFMIDVKLAIFFTIFSIPVLSQILIVFLGNTSIKLIIILTFFLLIIALLKNKESLTKFKINSFIVSIFIFSIYLLFSTFFVSKNLGYGLEKFLYYFLSLLIMLIPSFLIENQDDILKIIQAVVFYGMFCLLYSIIQYYNLIPNPLEVLIKERFAIFSINPIMFARDLLASAMGILFYIYLFSKSISCNFGKIMILLVFLFLMSYFAALTGSRGPIIAFVLGIISITFVYAKKKRILKKLFFITIITVSIIAILMFTLLPALVYERLLGSENSSVATTAIRFLAIAQGISDFWQNKIFGIGFGSFHLDVPFFEELVYPHNMIIEILAETGIIGISLFLFIIIPTIKMLIYIYTKLKFRYFAFVIGFLIFGFVNTNFSGHIGYNRFFWFSLGIIYSLYSLNYETKL